MPIHVPARVLALAALALLIGAGRGEPARRPHRQVIVPEEDRFTPLRRRSSSATPCNGSTWIATITRW